MATVPVPPEELRLWVGPFHDEDVFLRSGLETAGLLESMCGLRPNHTLLDVGCGSGRVALALVDYLSPEGGYVGFDVSSRAIAWCQQNIESRYPNFRFQHVDALSPAYNPGGRLAPEATVFPCDDASIDIVLLSSVFTHLLPSAMEAYARETARVLRPGGRCLISYFLMDAEAEEAVAAGSTIFDFRYRIGPAITFAPANPTEGVAYTEDFAFGVLRNADLEIEQVRRGTWRSVRSYEVEHDWLAARKPSDRIPRG